MTTLASMLQQGEKLKHHRCEAKGCTRNRAGMAPHCHAHTNRKHRYGHPLGAAVATQDYARETEEVKDFFKAHSCHPAINSALVFIDGWKRDASEKKAGLLGDEIFIRLSRAGIPALDILTDLCAIWIYAERNPRILVDDQRLTFCLARNIARLAGLQRKTYGSNVTSLHPRPAQLREAGERIRQTLARLFVNISAAFKAQEEQTLAAKQDLATPFI